MIDYHDLVSKRVMLLPSGISGVAHLDEDNEMFQIEFDDKTIMDDPDDRLGIRCKRIEKSTITELTPDDARRQETGCEYTIEL